MSGNALARRLEMIERRIGLHRVTVTRPCPRCDGRGSVEWPPDLGVLRHAAAWLGEPEPEPGPTRACVLCRGRGQVAVEVADQFLADAERAGEKVIVRLQVQAERYATAPALPGITGSAAPGPADGVDSTERYPDSPPNADER